MAVPSGRWERETGGLWPRAKRLPPTPSSLSNIETPLNLLIGLIGLFTQILGFFMGPGIYYFK